MLRDAAGNPIPQDTVTQRPNQAQMVQLPQTQGVVPQGVTQEMLEFFDKRVDEKIQASVHGLHIRTREQAEEDYRKDFRNKVFIGAGGVLLGLGISYAWRKWRGDGDEYDDDDEDMNDNE